MKKIKMLSLSVIIISVIVLGGLAGKHFFSYLEAKASGQFGKTDNGPVAGASGNPQDPQQSSIVLYSAKAETENPGSPATVPAPDSAAGAKSGAPQAIPVAAGKPAETGVTAKPVTPPASDKPAIAAVPAPKTPGKKEEIDFQKTKWLAYATGNGTNVREQPSTDKTSKVVMKIGKGTRGRVLEQKDGWTRIQWDFNRKIGWTRDDLVVMGPDGIIDSLAQAGGGVASITPEAVQKMNKKAIEAVKTISVAIAKPAPPSQTVKGFIGGETPEEGIISASPFANIRSEPNRRAALMGKVPKGVSVKIKSYRKIGRFNWFEVAYHNGRKQGWTREDNVSFATESSTKR